MKLNRFAACCWGLAVFVAAGVAGCSRSDEPQAPLEIRGEAISPEPGLSAAGVAGEEAILVAELAENQSEPAAVLEPPTAEPAQKIAVTPPAPEPELAAPTSAPDAPAAAQAVRRVDGYLQVSFEQLAGFEYDVPEYVAEDAPATEPAGEIPEDIRGFDQKPVALQGFMLPLKVEGGLVTEMLIMRDQSMCCYGTVPRINEWVSVKMNGRGVRPLMDQAVTVFGKLRVGEVRENGYLVGIYEMDGEKMAGPQDL